MEIPIVYVTILKVKFVADEIRQIDKLLCSRKI